MKFLPKELNLGGVRGGNSIEMRRRVAAIRGILMQEAEECPGDQFLSSQDEQGLHGHCRMLEY